MVPEEVRELKVWAPPWDPSLWKRRSWTPPVDPPCGPLALKEQVVGGVARRGEERLRVVDPGDIQLNAHVPNVDGYTWS